MLPNLIIIGAMKSGTSSLHQYLNLHPEIQMSDFKELDFFISEKNWNKGMDWYKQQFTTEKSTVKVYGESSPNYTKSHLFAGVPERMFSTLPDAKLIYILRDPVKRILSHYYHQAVDSKENFSLLKSLEKTDSNYILTGCYFQQLQKFLDYYQREQILVITLEELNKNREKTLEKIFQFLGVNTIFQHPNFSQEHHLTSDKTKINKPGRLVAKLPFGLRLCYLFPKLFTEAIDYPQLDEKVLRLIRERLKKDIQELRIMTGQKFSDWMV